MAPRSNSSNKARKPLELRYISTARRSNDKFPQPTRKKFNVAEIVYGFLSNLAIRNGEKKLSSRRKLGQRKTSIKKPLRLRRESHRSHRAKLSLVDKGSTGQSGDPRQTSSLKLTESRLPDDATKRTGEIGDNVKMVIPKAKKEEKPMMKRSMMQMINKYIQTGFEKGKRQAKSYVRKALALAVDNGYLIPADKEGKFFRVSMALSGISLASRRASAEARKRRRNMRRGEEDPKKNERKDVGPEKETQKHDKESKEVKSSDKKDKKKPKRDFKIKAKNTKSKRRKSANTRKRTKKRHVSRSREYKSNKHKATYDSSKKSTTNEIQAENNDAALEQIKNSVTNNITDLKDDQFCEILQYKQLIKNEPFSDRGKSPSDKISNLNFTS